MGISSGLGGYTSPGLVLIKSQVIGSGVASVTVTDVFSANYDNYRIVISNGVTSSNGSLYMQLNNQTGNFYQHYGYYGNFGNATLNGYGPGFGPSWTDAGIGATTGYMVTMDICGPNIATPTFATTWTVSAATMYHFGLRETSSAQHTGFTFGATNVGVTLTGGTIRVYGYRN